MRRLLPLPLVLALAACGGGTSPYADVTSTPPPADTDILSLAVDPGDGTLMIATSPALYWFLPGDPNDPSRWAVSTQQGTFVPVNDRGTWRHRDPTFGARLAWAPGDGGASWSTLVKLR